MNEFKVTSDRLVGLECGDVVAVEDLDGRTCWKRLQGLHRMESTW